jgi:hypothetical protein
VNSDEGEPSRIRGALQDGCAGCTWGW